LKSDLHGPKTRPFFWMVLPHEDLAIFAPSASDRRLDR
jgi:hypothetical protein